MQSVSGVVKFASHCCPAGAAEVLHFPCGPHVLILQSWRSASQLFSAGLLESTFTCEQTGDCPLYSHCHLRQVASVPEHVIGFPLWTQSAFASQNAGVQVLPDA